jgi:hypothetical protein
MLGVHQGVQRTAGQRSSATRWLSRGSRVVLPPPLNPESFVVSLFLVSSHGAHYLISRYAGCMHVISRKMLCQFWEQYPESEGALAQ